MLYKTEGIVLRQYSYSETSLIVKIFTKEFGLLSFIVKGAKSNSKNSKAGILRPMNQLSLTIYYNETKSLLTLKEVQLLFAPDSKFFGIQKSAIGMFITEVLIQTITEEKEKDELKYNFIFYTFEKLKNHAIGNTFYLTFFIQYLHYLGISPSLLELSKESHLHDINLLEKLLNGETISILKIQRQQLFKAIELQYSQNISNFKKIKSIEILETVFS